MEDFIILYLFSNIIGSMLLLIAANERTVPSFLAFVISILCSFLVGYLFILCYPTRLEKENSEKINRLLERIAKQPEGKTENK